ncbi:MAG TPA: thioredoxin domain-containing protein [Verrucomicrobiales bacterium]|nr:thioredoxin domain-containing protein [Verrucomicrobiales bacterium]
MSPSSKSLAAETPGPQRKPIPPAEELANLPPGGGPEYNRLVFEKSPYLLQHAGNPVDWYPWGEEAFAAAKELNRPVFLSVGYATCHWCHVMEHESFEDEEVAQLLNERYICIKVDREESPHIDHVYMTVTQALTGRGGWPMTVVMTPERKPFFAGTYIPKRDVQQILVQLSDVWQEQPERVVEEADRITQAIAEMVRAKPGEMIGADVLDRAFANFMERFDAEWGGFGTAPKFPAPHDLVFLLRYGQRMDSPKASEMVVQTLRKMRLGGIYDHVGFGMHRYATDREWFLPHFEKMLYDQALLALAYLEAYQATGSPEWRRTAEEIFTYVLRDLRSPKGGFHSAEDAQSEGEEGKFYLWTEGELRDVLGEEEAVSFSRFFGATSAGNYVEEASGRRTGGNILFLREPLTALAEAEGIPEAEFQEKVESARVRLLEARAKRIRPLKDDKVLTDWNGLMIAALARGGVALGDERYTEAARSAADFIAETLVDSEGRLLKRYRDGEAGLPAHLEDYSFLVWGLIELYEASFETRYLAEALRLTDLMLERFWDEQGGGFFQTADDGERLILRGKDAYDGALPSGNGVAACNLVRLARMTGRMELEERARKLMAAFSGDLAERASGSSMMFAAVDFLVGDAREIVVVGERGAEDTQALLAAVRQRYAPRQVVLFKETGEAGEALAQLAPYVAEHGAIDGKATVYVCRNFACELPVTDRDKLIEMLESD